MAHPSYEVVIAAYNAEAYLAEAIESVLKSTVQPLRIWVVDDASTDRTLDIARQYGAVEIIRNATNQERSVSRNLALERVEADFVQILDADDLLHPHKVEMQLDMFASYPKIDVMVGDVQMFLNSFSKKNLTDLRTYPDIDILEQLIRKNIFAIHAMLFRRSFFQRFGFFREDMPIGEDRELYLRSLVQGAQFAYSPSALCYYRMHDAGTIATRHYESAYFNALAVSLHRNALRAFKRGAYREVTGVSLRTLARNANMYGRPFSEVEELLDQADECAPYPPMEQRWLYRLVEHVFGPRVLERILRLKFEN